MAEQLTDLNSALEFDRVRVTFRSRDGEEYTAVDDIDLQVRGGEFLSLVGPSGCGKSTLLTLASGLNFPSGGRVALDGAELEGVSHRVGFMFQNDALLPWKTVKANVELGPRFRGQSGNGVSAEADRWIQKVGLRGFENHFPRQLSGGMRKRVSLAQNLIVAPDILLMDEPFSALDVQTRALMENELLQLWSEQGSTVLFVTHDLEEAVALSDRVAVMTAGPSSSIKAVLDINLSRPRDVHEIKLDPEFSRVYKEVWGYLREEVLLSYRRQTGAGGVDAI